MRFWLAIVTLACATSCDTGAAPDARHASNAAPPDTAAPGTAAPESAVEPPTVAPSTTPVVPTGATAQPAASSSAPTPPPPDSPAVSCGFDKVRLRVTSAPWGDEALIDAAARSTTEITPDGRFCTTGKQASKGQLTAKQRARLERVIAAARLDVRPTQQMCDALPTHMTEVTIANKRPPTLRYVGPCGGKPHASVSALLDVLHDITHPKTP